jgi:hypothetical protein
MILQVYFYASTWKFQDSPGDTDSWRGCRNPLPRSTGMIPATSALLFTLSLSHQLAERGQHHLLQPLFVDGLRTLLLLSLG